MNPDSGVIRKIEEDLEGIERIAKGESPPTAVEADIARATKKLEARRALSTEPPPGAEVPADWPRFQIGDRLGPIKGWWFELVDVDVEAQEMLIKPLEPTKATAVRRTSGARKSRKRTRCGTRKRRRRGE